MKIIISPAKNLKVNDDLPYKDLPVLLGKTRIICEHMKKLSYDELKRILDCNDKIASTAYNRLKNMNLESGLSPALLSYDGIQYKYMAPQIFEDKFFSYVQKNLRILSGFYGILRPFDGITPHRLELQAKLKINGKKDLYDFWGKDIYDELTKNDDVIINLTSKEYSKSIEKYTEKNIKHIYCVFAELIDGKIVEKGVYVKMARGEMVRFLAENNIENYNDIKEFDRLGYKYEKRLSNENKYVFIKKQIGDIIF